MLVLFFRCYQSHEVVFFELAELAGWLAGVKKLAAFSSIWERAAQLSFDLLFMNTERKNEFYLCVFIFYVYLAFHRCMVVFTSVGVFNA